MITDLYNLKGVRTREVILQGPGEGGREGNGGLRLQTQGRSAVTGKIPGRGEDAVEAFGVGRLLRESWVAGNRRGASSMR